MIAYVVCTGPSLKDFDFSRLIGKKVIAVNYAVKFLKNYECVCALDTKFYADCGDLVKAKKKPMYAIGNYYRDNLMDGLGVKYLTHTGVRGYEPKPGHVKHGYNSGYFAIQLAMDQGYTDIRVLGMDGTYNGGSHFYNAGEHMPHPLSHLPGCMLALKNQLPPGIAITLYGPTVITAFPRKTLTFI